MIRIHNTETRRKEPLETVHPGEVRMYVCGPTVYNYIHIGNARTFLSFDVIRRYLSWRSDDAGTPLFKVTFVQNITDVDDKIIAAAAEEGASAEDVARRYENAFWEQMEELGVEPPDAAPRATEEIGGMIRLVETLLEKGHAYAVDGDVYFDVRSWASYGSLSGRSLEEMRAGERVEVDTRKKDPMDFALWKSAKPGEPTWDSPWGPGRPGWHLECSEMSRKYLGGVPFDIHGGATDLVFPHHENEKAQAEAAWGAFALRWIHGGLLNIDKEKMSKSLGNFTLLKDVLEELAGRGRDPVDRANIVRMLMLQTHYRSPLEFSPERLDEAAAALDRLATAVRNLEWVSEEGAVGGAALGDGGDGDSRAAGSLADAVRTARETFVAAMDDDFNAAGAIGALFELVRVANAALAGEADAEVPSALRQQAASAADALRELAGVLGLRLGAERTPYPRALVGVAEELAGFSGGDPELAAQALLARRASARAAKDWAAADAIRDRLAELELAVEDTPHGQRLVQRRP